MGAPFAHFVAVRSPSILALTTADSGWHGTGQDCFPELLRTPERSLCDITTSCCWSARFHRAIGKCSTPIVVDTLRDGTFETLLDLFLSILRNAG